MSTSKNTQRPACDCFSSSNRYEYPPLSPLSPPLSPKNDGPPTVVSRSTAVSPSSTHHLLLERAGSSTCATGLGGGGGVRCNSSIRNGSATSSLVAGAARCQVNGTFST